MTVSEWISTLTSRGIVPRVVRGRLRYFPAKSYSLLSGDEIVFARENRDEIKAEITAGVFHETTQNESASALHDLAGAGAPAVDVSGNPTNLATSAPELFCQFCGRTPCCGPDYHAYPILHESDPEYAKLLAEEEREQLLARALGWPTPAMIARAKKREEGDEEKRQRQWRIAHGWEDVLGLGVRKV